MGNVMATQIKAGSRLLLLVSFLAVQFPSVLSSPQQVITLPVCIHVVSDLVMNKNGQQMASWVGQNDINNAVLPEVNAIWRPAGIQFDLVCIRHSRSLQPPQRQRLLEGITKARRDADGKSDPGRIKKLKKLIDFSDQSPDAINIYFVPYLGEKSQGHAKRKRRHIFIGQWSDKKTYGGPPKKFQLTEPRPFKEGSISRTLAHELGHVLGLKHPNKKVQREYGLLMGGKKAGYRLTEEDISMARTEAKKLTPKE